jgi:hypothetical protein
VLGWGELARVGIDLSKSSREVDMRDLDVVELRAWEGEKINSLSNEAGKRRENDEKTTKTTKGKAYQHRSVVDTRKTQLRTNVHDNTAGEELPRLAVTEGDDERENALTLEFAVLAVRGVELSHDDRMIGAPSESTGPPLHSGDGGRLEEKCLRGGLVGRGGLESLNIGAVSELRLGVAAYTSKQGQLCPKEDKGKDRMNQSFRNAPTGR